MPAATPPMHPQLQEIVSEFESAERRLQSLRQNTPAESWLKRAHPDRWSIAECVRHLNLTSEAYLPMFRDGIAQARKIPQSSPQRYRRDFAGWMLWKIMAPPVRFKTKTIPSFMPAQIGSVDDLVAAFSRLQLEQMECVCNADGLPLHQIKITSPFNARLQYNLYACPTILPRHQHRHLWQAERVRDALTSSARLRK